MLPTDRSSLLVGAAAVGIPAAIWYICKGSKKTTGTDFESYLRNVETTSNTADPFSETSFEAYLRTSNATQANAVSSPQSTSLSGGAAPSTPADRAPVTVLFGTEYGFSKEIAEKLSDKLQQTTQYWCVRRATARWPLHGWSRPLQQTLFLPGCTSPFWNHLRLRVSHPAYPLPAHAGLE